MTTLIGRRWAAAAQKAGAEKTNLSFTPQAAEEMRSAATPSIIAIDADWKVGATTPRIN